MLKIALLINSNSLNNIESEFLNLAHQSDYYSVELLIIQINQAKDSHAKPGANFCNLLLLKLFSFIKVLDRLYTKNYSLLKNSREITSIQSLKIPHVIIKESSQLNTAFLSEAELVKVKKQEIDLIASCYFTNAKNNFHLCTKTGLVEISYDANLNLGFANQPIGFREVQEKNKITSFEILHNKERLSQSTSYAKGSIATVFPFILNKYRVERKAMFFLHHYIQKLSISNASPQSTLPNSNSDRPSLRSIYESINSPLPFLSLIKYLYIFTLHGLKASYRKLLQSHGKWSVGFIRNNKNWKDINFSEMNVIPNPSGHFLADPFLFSLGQLDYCFVEDYSFTTQKGSIKAYLLDGSAIIDQGTVLDEPFHLSYPNIFKVDEDIFMIPETAENKDIRIYRSDNFPSEWVLHKQLMTDISAADTHIFSYQDRWWMFTNIDSSDIGDHCSELHIFYADAFDSSSWEPHSQNPVITSSLQARNGGCVIDESGLFRAFQVQDYNFYGKSIGVAKINILNPDEYSESVVHSICPDFIPNIQGTHHLHCKDKMVAIDFFSNS
ncbi:hypothetical protein N9O31_02250 [Gammaproteobacteria bacterium]|nr:hypothetical protein [Gammaproteobacteria bacterium]